MNNRIGQILRILVSEDRYFTAREIALKLELSEKTIREEIQLFSDSLEENGIDIIAGRNGFKLGSKQYSECFKNRIQTMDAEGMLKQSREHYMLRKLLLNEGYIKLEDMADEMYLSSATINRLFKRVKKILSAYAIRVVSRPASGIRIEGRELDKRLCYIHSYDTYESQESIDDVMKDCCMEKTDYYMIMYIVQKAIEKHDVQLTDTGLRNLVIHLVYAISRVKKGNYIEQLPLKFHVSINEEDISKMIVENIEKEYQIIMPPTEFDYVCIHLIGKRLNTGNDAIVISKDTEVLINDINTEVKNHFGYDFTNDFELFSMLSLHIEPMLSRALYGLKMPNPILKEIKVKLPKGFECAVIASNLIEKTFNLRLADEELGYLAIHYNLAIERIHEEQNKKFLLICGSGVGTAKLLEKKIEKQFHAKSENITICGVSQVKNMDLRDIDYIVSTVKLPFRLHKKVIYIDNVLSDIQIPAYQCENDFKSLLKDDFIFLNRCFQTKHEVIDFLSERLIAEYKLNNEFKDLIWKRENLSPTEIGNLVALPHPYSLCTDQTVFAICTLKKAILWNKRKVKYIFMISFSKKDLDISHDINEKLLSLIMNPNWISQLDGVKTIEQLKLIIK